MAVPNGKCSNCGKIEKYETLEEVKSVCCSADLIEISDLPVCDHTITAEQERLDEVDGPCDDATDRK